MWFSVWMDFATGGGGGAGVLAVLAVLSSAFRNVLMRKKRTTTDFFINPPFASRRARTGRNYNKLVRFTLPGQKRGLVKESPRTKIVLLPATQESDLEMCSLLKWNAVENIEISKIPALTCPLPYQSW